MEVILLKKMVIEIDERLHIEMKVAACREGKTIKQYITDLIEKKLSEGIEKNEA